MCHLLLGRGSKNCGGVPGDDAFLVGRNHPDFHSRAVGMYGARALPIAVLIDLQAKPAAPLANLAADNGVILSNAAGEYQAVYASQGGGHGSDLNDNPVNEKGDRFGG